MRRSASSAAIRVAVGAAVGLCLPAAGLLAQDQRPPRCGTPSRAELGEGVVMPPGAGPADCGSSSTNPTQEYAPSFVYRIPVVFHVIRSTTGQGALSPEQVRSQIDILNEDFRALPGTNGANGFDCAIEFHLATVDPQGNATSGITYSTNNTWFNDGGSYWSTLAWDPNRYLNIYSNRAGGSLGYVPALPQHGIVGNESDRVVVLWSTVGRNGVYGPPYNQGRTATHEVGHYLGLYHTFDGGCGNSNCNASGDLICDTEPESVPHWGCPLTAATCGNPDPVLNYMNYTDDLCMDRFTSEQARRMRCTLQHWRPNVWTRGNQAYVTDRTGGENIRSYVAERPVLGATIELRVDLTTTGHDAAIVVGYSAPANTPLRAFRLLVDVAAPPGELLGLPPQNGPLATFHLVVPSEPALNGLTLYTQAAHFGTQPWLALSNAQDLTFGPS